MTPSSHLTRRTVVRGLGAAAVAAVGVPALGACSNEGRGGGGSQAENQAVELPQHIPFEGVEPDLQGADGVSNGWLAYPADPPTVTDGPPGDGQPVSVLTMSNSPAPPALGRNAFWQELNKRLGFEISPSLVRAGDYSDRFQTAVAGDQLPDIFSFFPGEIPSLPDLLNEKAVDLTPYLSGAAAQDYPFLANIPTDSWQDTVFGGKIFGIPIPRGAALTTTLYGRQDLLADEGIDGASDSWDSFHELCVEISRKPNRWALGAVPMLTLRQMHGVPNAWSEDGGALVSANEAEGQEAALEAGRQLVAEKLVHPDAFGVDQNERKLWLVNGSTPFLEGTFSGWLSFQIAAEPKVITVAAYAPPKAEGGGQAPIWLSGPTHNVTAISAKSADRAEALLGVLDYFAAPFGTAEHMFKTYGMPGIHHELDGSDPVLTEKGRSETALSLGYLGEGPYTIYQAGHPDGAQAQFDAMTELVPTAVRNPAQGLFSQTQSRKRTQIDGALNDLQDDILQGRKPVSAWADGVATWKKNGGDQIRDELQAALTERQNG